MIWRMRWEFSLPRCPLLRGWLGLSLFVGRGLTLHLSLPPPLRFLHLLNYLYFGIQVFLLFLFLFSALSGSRNWGSEQAAVWLPHCWLGAIHHNIMELFNSISMCTVADFIAKVISMAIYIKVKTIFMPTIHSSF